MLGAWLPLAGTVPLLAGISAWGACHPGSQLFGPTIRRNPSTDGIGLTFDDGPNPAVTPRLLDLLDRHEAKATFFVIGRFVRGYPAIVRDIVARGHVLANHTQTHPNLALLSRRRIIAELTGCQWAIEDAGGVQPTLMRPPFGYRGPQLHAAVAASGLATVVMWSRIGRDWTPRGQCHLIARLGRVTGGDVLVLHDGHHRAPGADRGATLAALEHWLPRWTAAGWRCRAVTGQRVNQPPGDPATVRARARTD